MVVINAQKMSITDDFTNANKNGLTHGAFTWAQPNASIPRILSNAAANSTTAGYFPAVLTSHRAMTDTHYVSAFNVGANVSATGWGLIVGADAAFDNYAAVIVFSNNVALGYGTGPGAGEVFNWVNKGSAPSSNATLQAWRFEKHVAANGALYRVYCNATLEIEYLDTANTIPSGPNNRHGGLIVQRLGFTNSPGVDGFSLADLYP